MNCGRFIASAYESDVFSSQSSFYSPRLKLYGKVVAKNNIFAATENSISTAAKWNGARITDASSLGSMLVGCVFSGTSFSEQFCSDLRRQIESLFLGNFQVSALIESQYLLVKLSCESLF